MRSKKVLLVSPNTETFPVPVYPLALPRLAAALENAGHVPWQFDTLVHGIEALPGLLKDFAPDAVAISIRNIDNVVAEDSYSYFGNYSRIIGMIRARTKVPIILGGSGFSIFPTALMKRLEGDFGVTGPGEQALCALLKGFDEGVQDTPRIVKGTAHLGNKEGSFIPGTRHRPELIDYYWRRGGMIGLQTKLGCLRNCSYCTYPLIDGDKLYHAAVKEVLDEMEFLFRTMGVSYFFFVDSAFNQQSDHELALANEIIRRSLPIKWGAFFSPCEMDRSYLETLQKSGLTHVEFGTEALSDRVLGSYNKAFTAAEAMASSALATELGLYTAHYLLFGGPAETPETVKETLANAKQLAGCVFFPFVGIRIYPGTGIFQRARRELLINGEDDCFDPVFYLSPEISHDAIWEMVRHETEGLSHWVCPSDFERLAPAMRRMRMRGARGPLWEQLIRDRKETHAPIS